MFAKVVIDMKNEHIDDYYDYLIPQRLAEFVGVGSRVIVSFGYQELLGYVIELSPTSQYQDHIKEIIDCLDFEQELTEEQVELAKFITNTYHVSLTSTLELMIPSYLKGKKRKYLVVHNYDLLNPKLVLLLEGKKRVLLSPTLLENYDLIKKEIEKENISIEYDIYTYGKNKKTKVYYVNNIYFDSVKVLLNEKRQRVLDYLLKNPASTSTDIIQNVNVSYNLINNMVKNEDIRYEEITNISIELTNKTEDINYIFNFDQNQSIEKYQNMKKGTCLLNSNDEAFKINFIINIIKNNASINRQTIITTPTIMLCEEIFLYLNKHLKGYKLIKMSSKNKKEENYETFMNTKYNSFDCLVTTLSGIFLPFNNANDIIVIDEENIHYINENYPYFDAVEVLQKRASYQNARLLLVTSAPAVNTYYDYYLGKMKLIQSRRTTQPIFEIIDKKNALFSEKKYCITNTLIEEISQVLANKKQVMLIVDNKSYSSLIRCESCKKVLKCPKCHIPLSYHKDKNIARCNLCGYKQEKLVCECQGKLEVFGFGLERLKEDLQSIFFDQTIVQIDASQMVNNDYEDVLSLIEEKKASIIIGTSILSKKLNDEDIELIGLLSVDNILNMSDYRAEELLYQTIVKATNHKKIVIETYYPNNKIIDMAIKGNYEEFYNYEMAKRKSLNYPPIVEMNKIIITGDYGEMYHFANYFKKVYERIIKADILGPTYDYKEKGVKLLLKHNDYERVIKIFDESKDNFKNSNILIDFQRKPKGT